MSSSTTEVLACKVCKLHAMVVLDGEGYIEQVVCPRCGAEIHGLENFRFTLELLAHSVDQEAEDIVRRRSLEFRESRAPSSLALTPIDELLKRFSIVPDAQR